MSHPPGSLSNLALSSLHSQIESMELKSVPDESRISEIIKNIEIATQITLTAQEVKDQIQKYLENSKEKKANDQELLQNKEQIQSRIGSMFRQFEDFPAQHILPPSYPSDQQIRSANELAPSYRSKRKIKPTNDFFLFPLRTTIQDKVQAIDFSTQDCITCYQRRSSKKQSVINASPGVNQANLWIYHEYFYCNYDRAYFKSEEPPMKKLINDTLKSNSQKLTYKTQKLIRKALGKPKQFNAQFILSEQEKLWQFRAQARGAPRSIVKLQQKQKNKVEQSELSVGKQITALHPSCGHLHVGSILALYKQNLFMVKFAKPELGTAKVQDFLISSKPFPSPSKSISDNIDHQLMAITIKLLEYKTELLRKMKYFNNEAQRMKREEISLDNQFLQEYGWIGSTINILTIGMKHIIARFRMRGLSNAIDQEKVGKNFASILLNPLNVIGRQLDKSSEESDLNASQQIQKIINSHKQNQQQQAINTLMQKYLPTLDSRSWQNTSEKDQIARLLKICVGLLVSLKNEGRNFNVDDNCWVNELVSATQGKYTQHFNEIYETLHSITGKLGDGAVCILPQ